MRRQIARASRLFFALAIPALAAAGCESTAEPSGTDSTTTPTVITETFVGTVAVNGAATFSFGVTASGSVTAAYKNISPTAGSTMGLALGIWSTSGTCNVVIANDNAILNSGVVGNASAAGTLCVRAYDVGRLSATQTVELTITHY